MALVQTCFSTLILPLTLSLPSRTLNLCSSRSFGAETLISHRQRWTSKSNARKWRFLAVSAELPPLDLTEENVRKVLIDARSEFAQIFDTSIGMTGEAEFAEMDGPFVTLSLRGRFWHKRTTVLSRLGNYLKKRIPEILEVSIEDEQQLDDSPENF